MPSPPPTSSASPTNTSSPTSFAVVIIGHRKTIESGVKALNLHGTRHWAQIALALRRAGHEPPGNHDLFFSKALR